MKEQQKQNTGEQQNQGSQKGEYKNIETSVNNPSYFDNDYAADQEDKITEQERKSQQPERPGRS